MEKCKWGIIGPGKIAHKFVEGLSFVPDSELYGVASSNIERAQDFANKYSATKVYSSYEELVKDSDIDVVYIATTNNFHFEHVMLCITNNKNCLCEKPFTLNSEQLEIIVAEARKRNVFVMEALWTRFLPSIQLAQKMIANNEIGEVKQISADFGFAVPYSEQSRLFSPQLGGGALYDIGIYPIFFALYFLGEPKDIKVSMVKTDKGVDISNDILFIYDTKRAELQSSFSENLPCEAKIIGEQGTILLKKMWHCPTQIVLEKDGKITDITPNYFGNGYNYEIEEVQNCIKNKKLESSKMSLDFSILIMKIIDKVYKLSN